MLAASYACYCEGRGLEWPSLSSAESFGMAWNHVDVATLMQHGTQEATMQNVMSARKCGIPSVPAAAA